jgi:hypothetical protein
MTALAQSLQVGSNGNPEVQTSCVHPLDVEVNEYPCDEVDEVS